MNAIRPDISECFSLKECCERSLLGGAWQQFITTFLQRTRCERSLRFLQCMIREQSRLQPPARRSIPHPGAWRFHQLIMERAALWARLFLGMFFSARLRGASVASLVLAAARCDRCRLIGFPQCSCTLLAADLDRLAAEVDLDGLSTQFAVAGGTCGSLHLITLP